MDIKKSKSIFSFLAMALFVFHFCEPAFCPPPGGTPLFKPFERKGEEYERTRERFGEVWEGHLGANKDVREALLKDLASISDDVAEKAFGAKTAGEKATLRKDLEFLRKSWEETDAATVAKKKEILKTYGYEFIVGIEQQSFKESVRAVPGANGYYLSRIMETNSPEAVKHRESMYAAIQQREIWSNLAKAVPKFGRVADARGAVNSLREALQTRGANLGERKMPTDVAKQREFMEEQRNEVETQAAVQKVVSLMQAYKDGGYFRPKPGNPEAREWVPLAMEPKTAESVLRILSNMVKTRGTAEDVAKLEAFLKIKDTRLRRDAIANFEEAMNAYAAAYDIELNKATRKNPQARLSDVDWNEIQKDAAELAYKKLSETWNKNRPVDGVAWRAQDEFLKKTLCRCGAQGMKFASFCETGGAAAQANPRRGRFDDAVVHGTPDKNPRLKDGPQRPEAM